MCVTPLCVVFVGRLVFGVYCEVTTAFNTTPSAIE